MKSNATEEDREILEKLDLSREKMNWSDLEREIYSDAFDQAWIEGFKIGRMKRIDQIVLNLIKQGFSFSDIAEVTEYSESKVKELRELFIKEGLLSS